MGDTKIEWATKVWNPLRGCSKVSAGCANCYAARQAHRFAGEGMPYVGLTQAGSGGPNWTGKIRLVPEVLSEPLKWRKPQRVFVNSMSDLFHPDVPVTFIHEVFKVMAEANWHTFQILTKRPSRMLEVMQTLQPLFDGMIFNGSKVAWPLSNCWLGVSVENQKAADERIPLLIQIPAAVRFLSCEPLLGPVNMGKWLLTSGWVPSYYDPDNIHGYPDAEPTNEHIQWVIAGGESGPGARPMHPDWARSLRDQCQAAGVAFYFKQWGEWLWVHPDRKAYEYASPPERCTEIDGMRFYRIGKNRSGRLLDGREWNEFPEVLI